MAVATVAPRMCAAVLLLQVIACGAAPAPRNVVLVIGDGVGIPSLHAASIFGYGRPRALFIQRASHIALADTSSATHWVTDSAAGMTAIVTGHKTDNGFLSVSSRRADGAAAGAPLKTILEYAEERGLSTGIVTNDGFMASATAAACYAHVDHRHKFRQIYDDFLSPRFGDGVDLVVARRADSVENAMTAEQAAQLPRRGYGVYDGLGDLSTIPAGALARAMVFLPPDDEVDLVEATASAIELLRRNPRGFFLMVESDAHSEDVPQVLRRTVELDAVVRDTTAANRHDTLVLFTADHSFDLRIPGAEIGADIVPAIEVRPFHTGEEVLVAADGPAADRVRGIMPNTELFHVMLAAYGWTP